MSTTVVHLLRHGEVHNPDRILYGRLPGFRLSQLGEVMAARAAATLADRDVVLVRSSPLERAVQTAEPVAAEHELAVDTDERLLEAVNVFEGQQVSVGDGALRKPSSWRHLYNPFKPSWGEPYQQIAERMRAAIDDVRRAAHGHEAVLVSHQLPIWVARLSLEGRRFAHDPRRRQCGLASITSLRYEDERLVALTYVEPSADLIAAAGPQTANAHGA